MPLKEIPCPQCDTLFKPYRTFQIFCSRTCYMIVRRRENSLKLRDLVKLIVDSEYACQSCKRPAIGLAFAESGDSSDLSDGPEGVLVRPVLLTPSRPQPSPLDFQLYCRSCAKTLRKLQTPR